jgi:hypothetical protein
MVVESAVAAGLVPGGPPVSVEQWSALVSDWLPELLDDRVPHGGEAVLRQTFSGI